MMNDIRTKYYPTIERSSSLEDKIAFKFLMTPSIIDAQYLKDYINEILDNKKLISFFNSKTNYLSLLGASSFIEYYKLYLQKLNINFFNNKNKNTNTDLKYLIEKIINTYHTIELKDLGSNNEQLKNLHKEIKNEFVNVCLNILNFEKSLFYESAKKLYINSLFSKDNISPWGWINRDDFKKEILNFEFDERNYYSKIYNLSSSITVFLHNTSIWYYVKPIIYLYNKLLQDKILNKTTIYNTQIKIRRLIQDTIELYLLFNKHLNNINFFITGLNFFGKNYYVDSNSIHLVPVYNSEFPSIMKFLYENENKQEDEILKEFKEFNEDEDNNILEQQASESKIESDLKHMKRIFKTYIKEVISSSNFLYNMLYNGKMKNESNNTTSLKRIFNQKKDDFILSLKPYSQIFFLENALKNYKNNLEIDLLTYHLNSNFYSSYISLGFSLNFYSPIQFNEASAEDIIYLLFNPIEINKPDYNILSMTLKTLLLFTPLDIKNNYFITNLWSSYLGLREKYKKEKAHDFEEFNIFEEALYLTMAIAESGKYIKNYNNFVPEIFVDVAADYAIYNIFRNYLKKYIEENLSDNSKIFLKTFDFIKYLKSFNIKLNKKEIIELQNVLKELHSILKNFFDKFESYIKSKYEINNINSSDFLIHLAQKFDTESVILRTNLLYNDYENLIFNYNLLKDTLIKLFNKEGIETFLEGLKTGIKSNRDILNANRIFFNVYTFSYFKFFLNIIDLFDSKNSLFYIFDKLYHINLIDLDKYSDDKKFNEKIYISSDSLNELFLAKLIYEKYILNKAIDTLDKESKNLIKNIQIPIDNITEVLKYSRYTILNNEFNTLNKLDTSFSYSSQVISFGLSLFPYMRSKRSKSFILPLYLSKMIYTISQEKIFKDQLSLILEDTL